MIGPLPWDPRAAVGVDWDWVLWGKIPERLRGDPRYPPMEDRIVPKAGHRILVTATDARLIEITIGGKDDGGDDEVQGE